MATVEGIFVGEGQIKVDIGLEVVVRNDIGILNIMEHEALELNREKWVYISRPQLIGT